MNNLWLLQDDIDCLEADDIFPLNKDVILSKITCLYDQLGYVAHLYDTKKINRDMFVGMFEKENAAIFRMLDIITPVFELKLGRKAYEVIKIDKKIDDPKKVYTEFTGSEAWDIETKNLCAIYHGLNGYSIMIEICINQLDGYKDIEWWYDHTWELIIKETEDAIVNEIEERTRKKTALLTHGHSEDDAYKSHYFMVSLKNDAKNAYDAMEKAIKSGLVNFKNDYFDFICDKGCVGLFFREGGFTEYKKISRFTRVKGEEIRLITLQNCPSNTPPAEWEGIKSIYYGNHEITEK